MCEEQGLEWNGGDLPTKYNIYNDYEEETCINLNNLKGLSYCDINYYKVHDYKIITYKDFMKEAKKDKFSGVKWYTNGVEVASCTYDGLLIQKIIEEKPVEILDKVERNYLKKVINPWKDKVEYITKNKSFDYDDTEYLKIECTEKMSVGNVLLPYFEVNTMYKGLELDKKYTLEELDL
jgi:hypothetical protein